MTHSENATKLVQQFEGYESNAYQDGNGVWTIGYGHTGPGVYAGLTCAQEEAAAWLSTDLEVADRAIAHWVTVPLTQNQYDALVSLIYNIGQRHFAESTVCRALNHRDYGAAASAFALWNKINGQPSVGLERRRDAEAALFMKGQAIE